MSYRHFSDLAELQQLVENDLALLLSERFEMTEPGAGAADEAPLAGAVPVPATPLLGRERESAAVEELVVGEGVRLVTLTGPGGVGKSRLMVEAARRLGPGFADGARFLELASVSAPDLVAAAIATGLGLNTSASQVMTDLELYLRPRRLLLALDNFEQVMGAAPLLAELLGARPVVLVTSRTLLRLSGEHEYPCPRCRSARRAGATPGPAADAWARPSERHAAYFQAVAEPAEAELAGHGQLTWLRRLDTEHDNAWASMSWLADQGHLDQAVHMFLMTWRFWWLRGHVAELARLADDIVAGSEDLPTYQRALALTGAGFIVIANGDRARSQTIFEQSLPLYRQTSEKLGVTLNATVLAVLGHLAATRRDYAGASKRLDEGQALARELRDEDLAGYDRLQQLLTVAFIDNFLGQVRLGQADNDAAARLFTDGLTVARRANDRIPILISLYDLALSSHAQGDLAGAAGHLKEGLAIAAEAGDETSAAYYLEALAAAAGQQNNPRRAIRLLSAARSQLEANGSGWLHAYVPRAPHDDAVLAALRARVGDVAYQEAQDWGRTIESGRARQYALE